MASIAYFGGVTNCFITRNENSQPCDIKTGPLQALAD